MRSAIIMKGPAGNEAVMLVEHSCRDAREAVEELMEAARRWADTDAGKDALEWMSGVFLAEDLWTCVTMLGFQPGMHSERIRSVGFFTWLDRYADVGEVGSHERILSRPRAMQEAQE